MNIGSKTGDTTAFAYMGDAVYEVYVRKHVLEDVNVKTNRINALAIDFVRADSQAEILRYLIREELLTEEELALVKRARNRTNTSRPRGSSPAAYKLATGFEALVGWLFMTEQHSRLEEICRLAVAFMEEYRKQEKG